MSLMFLCLKKNPFVRALHEVFFAVFSCRLMSLYTFVRIEKRLIVVTLFKGAIYSTKTPTT